MTLYYKSHFSAKRVLRNILLFQYVTIYFFSQLNALISHYIFDEQAGPV